MSNDVSDCLTVSQNRKKFHYPHLKLSRRATFWITLVLFIVTPLLSMTLVEAMNYNNPWKDFTAAQNILNLVWYYIGELFFYFIRGRMSGGIKISVGAAWGLGLSNRYLLNFRGRALLPADFLSLRTAANVAGNYNFMPDESQIITFLIMVGYILVVSLLPNEQRKKFSWKVFAPVALSAAVYTTVFFNTGLVESLGIKPSLWTTRGNGLLLNFSICMKYSHVEKPEDYSEEYVDRLAERTPSQSAQLPSEAGTTRPVNVIAIMNEALSDLSVLPGVETNQDAMPFYRELRENAIKGYAYPSVFGGTTANSEYEFLTGNTTALLPPSTVPYHMFTAAGDPTLVAQMKAQGYRCVAAHPYRPSGWNRVPVYNGFGFDEMYFEKDFQNKVYLRGDEHTGYVSDRSDYENLVRMYEEKEAGERLFLFNVTMQNHSGYAMPWDGLERTTWLTGPMEGRYKTVDQYLSLVRQSDLALEYLVQYFSQVDEPTMIVIFGDHQPQVATNFYTRVLGEDPDLAVSERKQMVPFLIWANYDIPEQENVHISLNYLSALLMDTAHMPLTGYQQFLLGLREKIPVINAVGIKDSADQWYHLDDTLPVEVSAALEEYKNLQYNNIFDKGSRADHFFELLP